MEHNSSISHFPTQKKETSSSQNPNPQPNVKKNSKSGTLSSFISGFLNFEETSLPDFEEDALKSNLNNNAITTNSNNNATTTNSNNTSNNHSNNSTSAGKNKKRASSVLRSGSLLESISEHLEVVKENAQYCSPTFRVKF